MPRRKSLQVGDVMAIPLPDGRFGYCRVFRDVTYGIYDYVSDTWPDVAELIQAPFVFWSTCFSRLIRADGWIFLENVPFPSEKDCWPPPRREFRDDLLYMIRVHFRGWTADQWFSGKSVSHLENLCFIPPRMIVERIERQVVRREAVDPLEYSGALRQLRLLYGDDYQAEIERQCAEHPNYPDFTMEIAEQIFPVPKPSVELPRKKSDEKAVAAAKRATKKVAKKSTAKPALKTGKKRGSS